MALNRKSRIGFLAGAALTVLTTGAHAAEWRLVDIAGPVRIAAPGGAPAAGRLNQTLPTGTSVTTAAGGRATLDNGDQHIVVGPNSRLTVQPDAGGFTRIAQDLGAAMFKVDKKQVPHFRVDTPLLAAIVKGTTFTVMVEGVSDAVSVAEGLVEVRSNLNAAIGSDVAAGATGTVLRDAPQAVQVLVPAVVAGPAAPPVNIAPIDYKAASGGLIDVAPAVARTEMVQAAPAVSAGPAPSNNAIGVSMQDSPGAAAPGASVAAVASQIAGLEASQRETPVQLASATPTVAPAGGLLTALANAGNSGNGNNGGGSNNVVTPVVSTVAGVTGSLGLTSGGASGNGNSGNGNNGNGNGNGSSGNGNANNGNSGNGNNGNGNGGSNSGGLTSVISTVTNATTGLADGSGNNGNGNSGNGNGNSGNGNANNGNSGNGNNGNGNGNGGSNSGGLTSVISTVTNATTGLDDGSGNNGNANSGNGNGNNGNGNGNSGNGNGNGNNGNGNGNGGSSGGVAPTVVAVVNNTTSDVGLGLSGASASGNGNGAAASNGNSSNGNSGNGNSGNGNGNSGNGNSGNSGNGNSGNGNSGNGNGNGNGKD